MRHDDIWRAIDALAAEHGLSASGLARKAGLDATAFNPSKRIGADGRARWPSTESVAKVLEATGTSFADFAGLAEGAAPARRRVPVIGFAEAGERGFFDDAGFPVGQGWDEVEFPGPGGDGVYALEISGASMEPVYREGDRLVVAPDLEPRRGDRVVVKTAAGDVMAKEVARLTANKIELRSLNPDYPGRTLDRKDVAWIARILWASQ